MPRSIISATVANYAKKTLVKQGFALGYYNKFSVKLLKKVLICPKIGFYNLSVKD